MARAVIAVVIGYGVWTAIWLGGNALLFSGMSAEVAAGRMYAEVGPLLGVLVLSVVCSLCAGFAAAMIDRQRTRGVVWTMAVLLLATGVAVEIGMWKSLPVWYHVVFLALIVPVCLVGSRLRTN